jgi:hypothetical protein
VCDFKKTSLRSLRTAHDKAARSVILMDLQATRILFLELRFVNASSILLVR